MDTPTLRPRRDGWTPAAQAAFIAARAAGATVAAAAQAAGMSRRAAYRLRAHPAGAAVAATWPVPLSAAEHAAVLNAALDARFAARAARWDGAPASALDTRALIRRIEKLGARLGPGVTFRANGGAGRRGASQARV